ncbi:SprB repeat-containing protein [Ekhidna sp.]|uniref:SprB repeat-containing protein n=1 Tax=Ekhidna sp. TaxID=2608089 RepID=UPI003298AB72
MTSILQKLILIASPFFILSCISEQIGPEVDCVTSPVEITIDQLVDANCGASDGSFLVIADGGIGPYTFSSDFKTNSDGSFTQLASGNYAISVTDSVGCASEIDVTIKNKGGVNLDEIVTTDSGCGTSQGSIDVTASGGVEPYSYSLDGGSAQASNTFAGLSHGSYDVVVEDATGCETTQSVNILSGISYQNSIKSIIENNCAISGCHNGSVSPDLRSFSSIQSNSDRIKARTANGSMPRGRTLTQTQIDQIACWVDDGAPNN